MGSDISGKNGGLGLTPAQLVRTEAAALEALAVRLEGEMSAGFERAVDLVIRCGEGRGRVVVTGMGKSGIIAQKIAAILRSSCSPANFMHPGDAIHGEIGMLSPGSVVIALTYSGETKELLQLLHFFEDFDVKLITLTSSASSSLAKASDVSLDCSVEKEACVFGLSPTASTSVMLALGDALALTTSLRNGKTANDLENLHRKRGMPRFQ